ncbi:MAG TPA: hypothetical protein VM680_12090 [Verrucomicrobiae bacterium]|nr:hypothetical protein [Verrucomicrobiae bacterium]
MKSRALRIVLALTVSLTLFLVISVFYIGPAASFSSKKGKSTAGSGSTSGSASASEALGAKPSKFETKEERRARMVSNEAYRDDFKLSEQEIYLYVQAKGSNAVSLVAAFESTRDKEYLKTALEKFPNDPFVQFKALMWVDMPEDERAKLIDAFQKSSPTNAFPNFLAARAAMSRGDTQTAMAELTAAKAKGYEEYLRESVQGLEDAYRFTGRSEAEAKVLGSAEITLPHLAQLKNLGKEFLDLAAKAGARGDIKTQQQMLMFNWDIGHALREAGGGVPIITEFVGIAMENAALRDWPKETNFGDRAARDLVAENNAYRKSVQVATPAFEKWLPTAPDEEIIRYMDISKTSGEKEAFNWLMQLHPELKDAARQTK